MNMLVINRCPQHQSFWSIAVEGPASGHRVTPSKCCGRWNRVASWPIDAKMADDLEQLAKDAREAARG